MAGGSESDERRGRGRGRKAHEQLGGIGLHFEVLVQLQGE